MPTVGTVRESNQRYGKHAKHILIPCDFAFTRGASRTSANPQAPIKVMKKAFQPKELTIEAKGNPAFAAPWKE